VCVRRVLQGGLRVRATLETRAVGHMGLTTGDITPQASDEHPLLPSATGLTFLSTQLTFLSTKLTFHGIHFTVYSGSLLPTAYCLLPTALRSWLVYRTGRGRLNGRT